MTEATEQKTPRLVFIDVLRLVAAVQMIQGHSVASVLAPSYRAGLGFSVWTFARGLTSVIFLLTAGLAFALAEARAHDRAAKNARIRRALLLIALGYAMHAPLSVLFGAPLAETLRAALAVDVLQCIGVSLLSLELLASVAAGKGARVVWSAGLGLSALFAAPFARGFTLPDSALVVGNYFTARYGSLFPLLPWAGYVLCGFALGTLVLRQPRNVARSLALFAAASSFVGLLVLRLGPELPRAVSPGYSLVKLGCALALAALLAHALRGVTRLPRLLAQLAGETLFLYLSHVLILYADGVGLEPRLRDAHSPLFGLLLALVLLVVCSAGALGLRSLRAPSGSGTRAAPSP